MTGTGVLYRLALRRDRVMAPSWIAVLASVAIVTGASFSDLYAKPGPRHDFIAGIRDTAATLALYGRVYGDSVGALTAWRIAGLAMALAGVMAILIVVRHTRGDEESGRAELLGAGVVGRHAPLAAALLTAATAAGTLALVVALGLIAVGLGAAGAFALGISLGAAACLFAAVAAVAAQVAQTGRAATGLACGVLGAAYLTRAVGDAGPHWVSWLSPFGWIQQLRAYAGDRWWALAPVAALTAACVLAAARLVARRDLGAGLFPERPGPARGEIRGPLELAWRLHRGALAGWAAGLAAMGAAFGSIADSVGDFLGDSADVKDVLTRLVGEKSLVDAYLATAFGLIGLVAAAYGVQAALRARAEETTGLAEPLLATPVSRVAWALGHVAAAAGGIVVLLLAAGIPAGIAHAAQTGDAAQLPRVMAAALAQAPAAWVLTGIAVALFGLAPRASAAAWAVLAAFLLIGELGPVLELGRGVLDLSPFTHTPKLPGGALTAAPLWLTAIAAALASAGLAGLRRRDLA